ncbi:hypothetical protein LCGC14_0445820 [marine sediment metagenome]|uniref:Uncharacterized protein n=1 Tax=marine sediment metagenome TaxID=412755 RepID=A0A0F9SIZ3_9ZZZZ
MLRTYGAGPNRHTSPPCIMCHIISIDPNRHTDVRRGTYGLCGAPIGRIIGEYNAVPSGWILCEECYVEVARQRSPFPDMSLAVDAVQQLLEQDLPRARRLRYGADKRGFDERGLDDDGQPA